MGNDSLFSRSNQESGGLDDAEGVRIIDADTAAEAVERGDAVKRKPDDEPKYGDRPNPPDGPRPTLRFPLAGADAPPVIERPRVAAVEPRADDEALGDDIDEPMITLEPATGETELPHWTEPATGEVPRVIIGEGDADIDLAEQERWSSFANSGPRWRDEHDDWEDDVASDLAVGLGEEEEQAAPLGALDTSDRLTQEEFLTFDDLQVPTAPTLTGSTPAVAPAEPFASGAPAEPEPIRIQSTPTAPASPPASGRPARGRGTAGRPGSGRPAPSGSRPARGETDGTDGGAGRDVPQAVFVGVAIAAVAAILMKIGAAATMVLVEAVIVLAGVEFFSAMRRGGHRPATLLGLAAVAAYPLAVYWRGEPAMPLVLFLTVVFTMLWFILGIGGNAKSVPNAGITVLGVAYVGLLGSFAALLLKIPAEGVSLLLVTIVAAVFYDIGGFFLGRQFGRTPLASVSPNKTVEGLVGGMAAAVVATVVAAMFFGPLSFGQSVAFGLALAVAAPLGDLAESLMKRDLGIKDMGSLLPGHGGVLDRFDGMLFVLPTAFYMLRVLGII